MNIFEPITTQCAVAPGGRAHAGEVRPRIHLRHRHRSDALAGDDVRHVAVMLFGRAGMEQVRTGHVRVDEDGDGEPAEGRPAELLCEDYRRESVEFAAAVALRIPDAEESELPHLAKHFARDKAGFLPRLRAGLHLLRYEPADRLAQHLVFHVEERRRGMGERGDIFRRIHGLTFVRDAGTVTKLADT